MVNGAVAGVNHVAWVAEYLVWKWYVFVVFCVKIKSIKINIAECKFN